MPSIISDEKLQEEWAKDEEFQKFCIEEPARLRKQKDGRKKAEAFEALPLTKKMQAYCDSLKKSLPFVIFVATYEETPSTKGQKMGAWRKQAACKLNGLCVIDFDHVQGDVRKVWAEAYSKLSDEDKARILFVYVTPSGHGLKVVFMADANIGNLIDNQIVFSLKLGLDPDEACKDASRGEFLTTNEDVIFINEEKLINYENKEFGEKYNEEYHAGNSQPTIDVDKVRSGIADMASVESAGENQQAIPGGDGGNLRDVESLTYHGVPYSKIVAAWVGDKKIEQGDRHRTSLVLADHLRYITDNDPKLIEQILRETPFVKEIIEERNEDISTTVKSAQGYEFLKGIPKRMQLALKAAGANSIENGELKIENSAGADNDVYAVLPLEEWAKELQEMAQYYPCMKELFLNVHPHKLPAVLFSSAALFGTLMTRAWYHFWYEPELVRRLNYSIFIIGDPGAGKNVIEKFYKKIANPMIQSDKCLIDAVNRYKEGRTERTTSTKAQKGEALKRPVVGIRVHPARTATGEFIRHMNAAIETVQGQPLNLHMFSFDAELDNVTRQNKGGDYKATTLGLYDRLSIGGSGRLRHNVSLRGSYNGDEGYWYYQRRMTDHDHSNRVYYEVLSKNKMHKSTRLAASAVYRLDALDTEALPSWTVQGGVGLNYSDEKHFEESTSEQKYTLIDLAAEGTKYWRLRRLRLTTTAGGGYRFSVGDPTFASVRGKLLSQYTAPAFEYATANTASVNARAALDIPLRLYSTPTWLTVFAGGQWRIYSGEDSNKYSNAYEGDCRTLINIGASLTL